MKRIKRKYTDEFKLKVVKDYYTSTLGVRAIALKYNLPSKNYINNWEQYLIANQKEPFFLIYSFTIVQF